MDDDLPSLRNLNPAKMLSAGVTLIGLLVAIVLARSIGNTDQNVLSSIFNLLLPLLGIFAVISPKAGLYLLLCETAYLDLIKRLMVVFGEISKTDIGTILAAAPVTLAGICVGLVLQGAFRSRTALRHERTLILLIMGLLALVVITALRSDNDLIGKLQQMSEAGSYITLIFVVPAIFPTSSAILQFMRTAVLIYLPVAIYGLWQYFFGVADFEVTYMLTGLTMLVKELYDVKPRIFSTLNSNHAFSIMMAFCAALTFLHLDILSEKHRIFRTTVAKLGVASIYTFALVMSLRRTGWVVLALVPACCFCFRTVRRTVTFYVCAISLIVLLFASTDFIDQNWQAWQDYLPGGDDFQEQAFRIGTFTARVASYNAILTDPSLWSWFGLGRSQEMLVHDAIGELLVTYGFVGFAGVAVVVCVGLYQFHWLILRQKNKLNFDAMILLLSLITSNLITSIIFQSHIVIFPANCFFWLCVGSLFSLALEDTSQERSPELIPPNSRLRIPLPQAAEAAFQSRRFP